MAKRPALPRGYVIGVNTRGEIKKVWVEQRGVDLYLFHTEGLGWEHRVKATGINAAKIEAGHVFNLIKSEQVAQSMVGSQFESKIFDDMECEASELRAAIAEEAAGKKP